MQGVSQTRDLVGYGGMPPAWKLPGGAKLAVSMVVNFEEGAEFAVSDGDPQAEKISEVVSVVPPGRWDQGNEQIFAYGMRAGIWRMLAALEKHRVPATFYMCGRAVERLPGLARRIVEAGHEAACHGWLWRAHAEYADRERELNDLRRCIEVMKSATGQVTAVALAVGLSLTAVTVTLTVAVVVPPWPSSTCTTKLSAPT